MSGRGMSRGRDERKKWRTGLSGIMEERHLSEGGIYMWDAGTDRKGGEDQEMDARLRGRAANIMGGGGGKVRTSHSTDWYLKRR